MSECIRKEWAFATITFVTFQRKNTYSPSFSLRFVRFYLLLYNPHFSRVLLLHKGDCRYYCSSAWLNITNPPHLILNFAAHLLFCRLFSRLHFCQRSLRIFYTRPGKKVIYQWHEFLFLHSTKLSIGYTLFGCFLKMLFGNSVISDRKRTKILPVSLCGFEGELVHHVQESSI